MQHPPLDSEYLPILKKARDQKLRYNSSNDLLKIALRKPRSIAGFVIRAQQEPPGLNPFWTCVLDWMPEEDWPSVIRTAVTVLTKGQRSSKSAKEFDFESPDILNLAENLETADYDTVFDVYFQIAGTSGKNVVAEDVIKAAANQCPRMLHPYEFDLPHDELVAALRVCFLHGDELQQTTIKAQQGNIDYSPGYAYERYEKFPHACLDIVANEGNPNIDLVDLWFCRKCRAAYVEHHSKFFRRISDQTRRLHPSMLTQRVELEDYLTLHGLIDPAGLDERTQGRLQQRRDDVAELMQPDDELWEWTDGPSLSSIGGLALMRGDLVVQAWRDFRS